MIGISLCMILRDEEKTIGRCLSGAKKFVDEIIIVDTGSVDNTKEIVKSFGVKLYEYKWSDNFSEARNYAFSKATKDYILWLDGDDCIDEENIRKIEKLKKEMDFKYDAVSMEYSLARNNKGKTTYKLRRNRLIKRSRNYRWIGQVHEYLDVRGMILDTDIVIMHDKQKRSSSRNLNIFRKMEEGREEFTGRDLYYYGNELYDNGFFEEAYDRYIQFLELDSGWEGDIKRAIVKATYTLDKSENEKRRELVFKAINRFTPNGELLCILGDSFLYEKKYKEATFWYKSALEMEEDNLSLEIEDKTYSTWIPALNLCVCYCYLEEYKKGYYYNELAGIYDAPKEKINHNRDYLKEKMIAKNIKIGELKETLIWK